MHESINQILIRRDSLPISDVDNLINETRDTIFNHIYKNDLNWADDLCEDFFNLDLDYFESD